MVVKTLYRWREFGTLARGDRSHGDRARAAPDSLARTVSTLLRPSRAAARAADVRARRVQRQRSQIDAGDARARHPAGQEIFTALLFEQQPNFFKRIQELQQINLRI